MHDLKYIRENPAAFDAALARRGVEPISQVILDADSQFRTFQTNLEKLLAARNENSKAIGIFMAKGEHEAAAKAKEVVEEIKSKMPELEAGAAVRGGRPTVDVVR